MRYRNWWPIALALALVLVMAFGVANAGTLGSIYDNPDGTDPVGVRAPEAFKPFQVILDDGTPFSQASYNDWLFCANHTSTLGACYECAVRAYVFGHENRKLYELALSACNTAEDFR